MANIRKRGSKWQAQVRRLGLPSQIKSFALREDAVRWARQWELAFDRGEVDPTSSAKDMPLLKLLTRYESEITTKKRSRESEVVHLRQIKRHAIAAIAVGKVKTEHVARFRDDRLKAVSNPTVRKELTLLGNVFAIAIREWGLGIVNPVTGVKKPANGLARDRRLTAEEGDRFQVELSICRNAIIRDVIEFAKATGMRRGEILSLRWCDFDPIAGTARLQMTKNGLPRTVPLSPKAKAVLQRREGLSTVPATDARIFPVTANALRLAFERVCQRAQIDNFHFHDLRHEAISHFFEIGLSVPEVALISGHRDAKMLFRYTHLRPSDLTDKLSRLVRVP